MPTRKQRRRHEKARRHEWEYVYVDDEGHEVEVDPSELRPPKGERAKAQGKQAPSKRTDARGRPVRQIEPPSWRRVGKRALFMAPVFVVVMIFLNQSVPLSARIAPAILLLAFFLPFSYFTDSIAYRMYRKRLERMEAGGKTKAR